MKKLIAFSIAFSLTVSGFSQVTFQKLIRGNGDEVPNSVEVCEDGGFVIAGYTTTSGQGGQDMMVLKLDSVGNLQWAKTFGGTNDDVANLVSPTLDGGYLVAWIRQHKITILMQQ